MGSSYTTLEVHFHTKMKSCLCSEVGPRALAAIKEHLCTRDTGVAALFLLPWK